MALYGIDVSYAQGQIDWGLVSGEKDFAIIRAGYGAGNIDNTAVYNCDETEQLSFPKGLYWFSYAYTEQMARDEGIAVAQFAQNYSLSYPIFFDFEYDSLEFAAAHGVRVDSQLLYDMMNGFCEEVENLGFNSGIYYNADFNARFNIDYFLSQFPNRTRWIAQWGTQPAYYDIWQYKVAPAGTVSGIVTAIDLDIIGDSPTPPTPPSPTPVNRDSMPIWMYLKQF